MSIILLWVLVSKCSLESLSTCGDLSTQYIFLLVGKGIGPIPLPTKRKIYCVLRSPHVDKDSREHFETRTHRRLIDIYSPSAKTIDALMKLDLPSGVDIEVKL